jgi:hypothetical protein
MADNAELQLNIGSNLETIQSRIAQLDDANMIEAQGIAISLEIQRLIPLLTGDEKGMLKKMLDKKSQELEKAEPVAEEKKPFERAVGWAPTRADMRVVIDAARESLANGEANKKIDEEHIKAHNKNKEKMANKLVLAKAERDAKKTKSLEPIVEPVPEVAEEVKPAEIFAGPAMPDIDLDNKTAPVDNDKGTGAGRALVREGDTAETPASLINVTVPAESIQAENMETPAVIESADSAETGKPIEVEEPVKVAEPVANTFGLENSEAKNNDTVGDREFVKSPIVDNAPEPLPVAEQPSSQTPAPKVAIPTMAKESSGTSFINFFKKMIPKGDAGSDEFTMVVDAAQTRSEANKNENEESIKKAA